MSSIAYHASPQKDLETIQPKRTLSKDRYIGDYVFATTDIKLATMYLVTKGTATLMAFDDEEPWILICANSEEYLKHDRGGAIYTVSTKTFYKTPQQGLEDSEMVSEKIVKPKSKKIYNSSIGAMQEHGIRVYFTNHKEFNEVLKSKNQSESVTLLKPYKDT